MFAREAKNVFRDHLLDGEVRSIKLGEVITPKPIRGGNTVGKIVEGFRS